MLVYGGLGAVVLLGLCICLGARNTERMGTQLSLMEADYQTTLDALNDAA